MIMIANVSSDLRIINDVKEFQTELTKVAYGDLTLLPNLESNQKKGYGIFMSTNSATFFDLAGTDFKAIVNKEELAGFKGAIAIGGKFIAASLSTKGVKIFSLDVANNKLKVEASFNSSSFKLSKIDVQDLSYDPNRKILFILDHHTGVIPVKVSING